MQLTIKQFEELNLFSNNNIQKVIASVVNESSNAALVSMYEDCVILLDHEEGVFYKADYNFDSEKLRLTLEDFQAIELVKEEESFKDNISSFFESDNVSSVALTEAYKESVMDQEKFINELISESLSTKNFDGLISYKELSEANVEVSIKNEPFFKAYLERLETNPLTEVRHFNWKDKVVVSLTETEKVKLINSSAAEKASDLWKKDKFKKAINEALSMFVEDVEKGKEMIMALLEEYPNIFLLDTADRKTLFGKSIISSSALRENLDDLQKGLDIIFEDEDIRAIKDGYLSLFEEEEEDEEDDDDKEDDDKKDDDDKEEKAKELEPEEISKIAQELKKIAGKVEDEELQDKLKDLADKLDGSLEEGTRPELIKEAVYLLSL